MQKNEDLLLDVASRVVFDGLGQHVWTTLREMLVKNY